MSETERKYDKNFKLMAIELGKNREDLVVLAKELDIRAKLIYRWRREFGDKPEASFPGLSPQSVAHRTKRKVACEPQTTDQILCR